jgi:ABC-type sulfate transport system substrate-binding protein
MPFTQIARGFGPGGIAIVSACSAAAPTRSAGLIHHLNAERNVDAIVASAFDIDAEYGITLAQSFAEVIEANRGQLLTVAQAFAAALKKTRDKMIGTDAAVLDGREAEFVLAGNPYLMICPSP